MHRPYESENPGVFKKRLKTILPHFMVIEDTFFKKVILTRLITEDSGGDPSINGSTLEKACSLLGTQNYKIYVHPDALVLPDHEGERIYAIRLQISFNGVQFDNL